ncbi:sensor histidine kinase [Yinghuangia sp. YIM S09857]|uniref:sensor histidine kinase n=1 Tax=Yinghuangia sp. YIM S09857 TaxID=3436929 RepID=UPI003F53D88E
MRPRSVRARATAAASLVVALALAVGAFGLLAILESSLRDGLDRTLGDRARDLAAVAPGIAAGTELDTAGDEDIALVVAADGSIVAASSDEFSAASPPFTLFLNNARSSAGDGEDDTDKADDTDEAGRVGNTGDAGRVGNTDNAAQVEDTDESDDRADEDDPDLRTLRGHDEDGEPETFRVAAQVAEDGGRTVYVASNMDRVTEPVGTVRLTLLAGLPPLLVLLTLTTWLVVGRSLRPVEAIRAEVADISEHALDRRVPVPPTDDEIGRLARTMNAMLARLEHAGDRQRAFVADASHELQTPLASFRAQLEVALAHPEATDWPGTARGLLDADLAMERLVRDLLFLAREDEGGPPSRVSLFDLDDVTLEEAARLRSVTPVHVDTSRVSAAPVRGSRDDLTRLVRNLLDNAARHAEGVVTVSLSADAHTVTLAVEDDGAGVPVEFRPHLFERFTRADAARTRTPERAGEGRSGGTGLGLAIARTIVERHGGTIEAGDRPDGTRGARFTVRLPVAAI